MKRILGATITIANRRTRNRYGTGHGRHRQLQGLGPRHARLAVHAAMTWCLRMIDTLQDPAAPWRRSDSAP